MYVHIHIHVKIAPLGGGQQNPIGRRGSTHPKGGPPLFTGRRFGLGLGLGQREAAGQPQGEGWSLGRWGLVGLQGLRGVAGRLPQGIDGKGKPGDGGGGECITVYHVGVNLCVALMGGG